MTDLEYDILDEMYFIITYNQLLENLNWEKPELNSQIKNLLDKKWVKAYENVGMNEIHQDISENEYCNYLYLASKTGLMAHNCK